MIRKVAIKKARGFFSRSSGRAADITYLSRFEKVKRGYQNWVDVRERLCFYRKLGSAREERG